MNIVERIARAGNSSNLKPSTLQQTDVDVLIACGWTPDRLGRKLMALRSEWDGLAKPLRMGETDAVLLIGALRSLSVVTGILHGWALRKGVDDAEKMARAIVAYTLDNTCRHCFGRGSMVIPGTNRLGNTCPSCRGTGKQREPYGDAGRAALALLDDAEMVAAVNIARRLHAR